MNYGQELQHSLQNLQILLVQVETPSVLIKEVRAQLTRIHVLLELEFIIILQCRHTNRDHH